MIENCLLYCRYNEHLERFLVPDWLSLYLTPFWLCGFSCFCLVLLCPCLESSGLVYESQLIENISDVHHQRFIYCTVYTSKNLKASTIHFHFIKQLRKSRLPGPNIENSLTYRKDHLKIIYSSSNIICTNIFWIKRDTRQWWSMWSILPGYCRKLF